MRPPLNTMNKRMFLRVLYYIFNYRVRVNIQHIFDVFRMYFTTVQLLRHVNDVVNMRL